MSPYLFITSFGGNIQNPPLEFLCNSTPLFFLSYCNLVSVPKALILLSYSPSCENPYETNLFRVQLW